MCVSVRACVCVCARARVSFFSLLFCRGIFNMCISVKHGTSSDLPPPKKKKKRLDTETATREKGGNATAGFGNRTRNFSTLCLHHLTTYAISYCILCKCTYLCLRLSFTLSLFLLLCLSHSVSFYVSLSVCLLFFSFFSYT